MVSRRIFFSICIMMVVLLAMFQFSLLVRDIGNDFNANGHLEGTKLAQTDSWAASGGKTSVETVVYVGSGEKAMAGIIRQWGDYSKRRVVQFSSLAEYERSGEEEPVLLCVAGSEIGTDAEVSLLSALTAQGQDILFCDLPDAATVERLPELQTLLGIREVAAEQVELNGIKLFSGFLLGGETIYQATTEKEQEMQDLTLFAPWYLTAGGTKTYMVGLLENTSVENEDLPALIWRSGSGNAQVYAVNGPYMYDETGLGILSAVLYELRDYELHPVVNAQNLSVANFPDFALENSNEMIDIYARNLRRLQMDLLWPNLLAAANKGNYRMTGFLTPQLDYSAQYELVPGDLTFYLRQFKEQSTEAGLSLDYLPGISLREKLEQDKEFFADTGSEYTYGAAYVNSEDLEVLAELFREGALSDISTLTGTREPTDAILSYFNDSVVDQGVTADGFSHAYSQDLRVRAIETALGYSNILLDMKHISWPEEDESHWEVLYEAFSSNINTYWNPFSAFDKTTLSESDQRTRAFFAMDYSESRDGDTIAVELFDRNGDVWFLLRTHAESVSEMTGGTFQKIEDGAYLICAQEDHLEISVERDDQLVYYLP